MMKETTSISGALVLQTTSPYRTIAQKHWGLTNEQMKGMHVHHRIHRSLGGQNDQSNLYVCSPSFHFWVWHGGYQYHGIMSQGMNGRKHSAETRAKMCKAQAGRTFIEESRKQMSESAKKRKRQPWSEETKRKMSESAKRRWAK